MQATLYESQDLSRVDLRAYVGELAELRKLIPVCMKCGRVRRPDGGWQEARDYMARHLGVDLSHALCDECLERWYPPAAAPAP